MLNPDYIIYRFDRDFLEEEFSKIIAKDCGVQISVNCEGSCEYEEDDTLAVNISDSLIEHMVEEDKDAYERLESCRYFSIEEWIQNGKILMTKYLGLPYRTIIPAPLIGYNEDGKMFIQAIIPWSTVKEAGYELRSTFY